MVDILLASYNGEKYIDKQITSIINQTYSDWKLYIRDDGSNDDTLKIINKYINLYPDKITLVKDSMKNLGTKKNFQELIKYSKNDYCMFCDQDDYWLEDKVQITLNKMMSVESNLGKEVPILIHTDLKVVDKDLNVINESIWNMMSLNPNRNKLNQLLLKTTVTGCTMMINSKLKKIIDEIPDECVMHDYWIALVASACGTIEFINKSTILYRQHGNNQVGAGNNGLMMRLKKDITNGKYELNIELAKILYNKYLNILDEERIRFLKSYIKLEKSGYIEKIHILLKNKCLTNSILRNIKILLLC